MTEKSTEEIDALSSITSLLGPLTYEQRTRVLRAVLAFYQEGTSLNLNNNANQDLSAQISVGTTQRTKYSADLSLSPKEFIASKQPQTDVERVACLAYYLTHYRDTQYLKTNDITSMNTEAAQPKFANTAYSVNNATQLGYLAPGPKGTKQISAIAERFVLALPDRQAAREVMTSRRGSRKARNQSIKKPNKEIK